MLVLTRKPGEKIQVGANVWITIVRINGGQVRIGIEAPREVAILRGEITALGWRDPASKEDMREVRPVSAETCQTASVAGDREIDSLNADLATCGMSLRGTSLSSAGL